MRMLCSGIVVWLSDKQAVGFIGVPRSHGSNVGWDDDDDDVGWEGEPPR
jgi:hypothetical protein